jgi:hypothetical protein
MPIKIVVIVDGGNVQHCYSDHESVEVEIIDFDNISNEGKTAIERAETRITLIQERMWHIY